MKMLIIDEISMTGQRELCAISEYMQKELQIYKPFAGKNVIFVGDFYQLPPVLDERLFKNPTAGSSHQTLSGFQLYNYVTSEITGNVVLLDTIMRTENMQYVCLQNKAREGNMTYENEGTIINDACYLAPPTDEENNIIPTLPSPLNIKDKVNKIPDYKPMVVVRNKTRKKLFESKTKSLSIHYKEHNIPLPIILTAHFSNVRERGPSLNPPKHKREKTKKQKLTTHLLLHYKKMTI
jgi:hypothetical protein